MISINHVKNIVSAVIDVPVDKLTDNASMDDFESWDSIAQMNLVIALEDEFDISIPDDEVGTIVSVQLILSLVNELLD